MNNDFTKIAFKIKIKEACENILIERIKLFSQAVTLAQESANTEEKSSMGDKHEASRAMSHNDIAMNMTQLTQAKKDLQTVQSLQIQPLSEKINQGSLFEIVNQEFFVGVGLGKINVDNKTVSVISYLSPLFLRVKMKTAGDIVLFGNKEEKITEVFWTALRQQKPLKKANFCLSAGNPDVVVVRISFHDNIKEILTNTYIADSSFFLNCLFRVDRVSRYFLKSPRR